MNTDDVQICAILRNLKSDAEYLHFGDFWIEKLREDDRRKLSEKLNYFNNYWDDTYIAVRDYYIGRGKSSDFFSLNSRLFFFPLFRLMKLFRKGDLIIPILFSYALKRWHEAKFHGDSYGIGRWLGGDADLYSLNKNDIDAFNIFRKEIASYLKHLEFPNMPYHKKHKAMADIDTRCFLAIHIFLKGSTQHHNPFPVIDALVDYTIALESLYLNRDDDKRQKLSSRIAVLLSKNGNDEKRISQDIKKFYDIRSDIVHGSLVDRKGYEFLCKNIYTYGDYLRKSILSFLDLNLRNPSKKAVLESIDRSIDDSDLRKDMQESLKILRLAM